MAPGQAELKFIDVRVAKAISAEATPGFEEQTPGQEFVVDHVEVALTLDAKLPAQFRKDLKNLIKSKLEMLDVPLEVSESVIPFPTPRPQPQQRELPPYPYPQPPPQPAPRAEPQAAPAPQPPPVPVCREQRRCQGADVGWLPPVQQQPGARVHQQPLQLKPAT